MLCSTAPVSHQHSLGWLASYPLQEDPPLHVHLGASSQPEIASGLGIDIVVTITLGILLTPVAISVALTILMYNLCAFFQPNLG